MIVPHVVQLIFAATPTPVNLSPLPHVAADKNTFTILTDTFFGLMGAISLLIVTISGFRYIIARGNSQDVAKAKNTILYALIGLVVSVLAVTIVNFVLGSL
jgi:hypothetical protein